MTPLVLACLATFIGAALHFIFTRQSAAQPTLARLGDWTMLAGVWAIVSVLITS